MNGTGYQKTFPATQYASSQSPERWAVSLWSLWIQPSLEVDIRQEGNWSWGVAETEVHTAQKVSESKLLSCFKYSRRICWISTISGMVSPFCHVYSFHGLVPCEPGFQTRHLNFRNRNQSNCSLYFKGVLIFVGRWPNQQVAFFENLDWRYDLRFLRKPEQSWTIHGRQMLRFGDVCRMGVAVQASGVWKDSPVSAPASS